MNLIAEFADGTFKFFGRHHDAGVAGDGVRRGR